MKRSVCTVLVCCFLLSSTVALGQPFRGEGCTIGPGYAATLLFPYFEVDLDDPLGVGTLLSIGNGRGGDALTRLVVWTDWGIPTLAFDVFIPALGIETINVGDLFAGNLPSTGAGEDSSGIPGCLLNPPSHNNPILTTDQRLQVRADHLGLRGPLRSTCAGASHGDSIARGYITVDVVRECSGIEASEPAVSPAAAAIYFTEGGGAPGVASDLNTLWGDIIYVDTRNNSAQGSEAIPIWANPTLFVGADRFTFYGRFSGWDGRDERVPLPSVWDQRFLNGGPFAGGADLIVWRDPGQGTSPVACGSVPSAFPLKDLTFLCDYAGDCSALAGDRNFPLATQRVSISSLGITLDFGYLELSFDPLTIGGNTGHQAWVQPSLKAGSLFSANFNGTPRNFLCNTDPTP